MYAIYIFYFENIFFSKYKQILMLKISFLLFKFSFFYYNLSSLQKIPKNHIDEILLLCSCILDSSNINKGVR